MNFQAFLDTVAASALSHDIAGADHLWTAGLQVVHVIGFTLLLASWALLALHAFGLVFRERGAAKIARESHRLIWLGLALAAGTGLVMVIGAPHHYFDNPAFRLKLWFFVLAVSAQVVTFSLVNHSGPAAVVRIGTGLSALLWLSVSFAGRAIGFV